jgi:hypothetical protein
MRCDDNHALSPLQRFAQLCYTITVIDAGQYLFYRPSPQGPEFENCLAVLRHAVAHQPGLLDGGQFRQAQSHVDRRRTCGQRLAAPHTPGCAGGQRMCASKRQLRHQEQQRLYQAATDCPFFLYCQHDTRKIRAASVLFRPVDRIPSRIFGSSMPQSEWQSRRARFVRRHHPACPASRTARALR